MTSTTATVPGKRDVSERDEAMNRPKEAAATGSAAAIGADLDAIVQRHMEPFLQRAKQITLEAIEEVGRRHGQKMLGELRQTVEKSVGALVRSEITALVEQLTPAVQAGSESARQQVDRLLVELKQFTTTTVVEVFRVHVPEYSRWAGQRVLDYCLGGVLLTMAAVLACVGGLLGLERAGVPTDISYLLSAAVALALGAALIKLRAWRAAGVSQGPARPPGAEAPPLTLPAGASPAAGTAAPTTTDAKP